MIFDKPFVHLFQKDPVVIFFEPAYPGEIDRLGNAVSVRIVGDNGGKGGNGLIKPVVVEMVFARAEQEVDDQFFRTQETDRSPYKKAKQDAGNGKSIFFGIILSLSAAVPLC
jgi:hypothetical protein